MGKTSIEWTDATWNPTRGCSRVSEGCRNCYAERVAMRQVKSGYQGLVHIANGHPQWTGVVRAMEGKTLEQPLHWKKPRRIFVNSMSDLFHEALPDEAIDRIFAVMALCPQHTFQVLTKRPQRMLKYFSGDCLKSRITAFQWGIIEDRVDPLDRRSDDIRAMALDPDEDWPLPNVWLGVSCEDQDTANERIPLLIQTPAAVRFVSYEPALGPLDFSKIMMRDGDHLDTLYNDGEDAGIDWVIIGGESGPGARPLDLQCVRNVKAQCKAAGVACFVKQLGANPVGWMREMKPNEPGEPAPFPIALQDRKGGDMSEWPADLRVRQFPALLDEQKGEG